MRVPVHNMNGEQIDEVELLESIFDIEPNRPVMHQALVRQLANARQGTASTKTRSEVNRTNAKVWRQKGTGRARQGSRRGPHWVGGGVAFGPKPRSYDKRMPRKMRRLAIRSTLAAKAQAGQLLVVDELHFEGPKTKKAVVVLDNLGVEKSAVVLVGGAAGQASDSSDENVKRSFKNISKVKTLDWKYINVRDLLSHDSLIMPLATLHQIEELWG